MRRSIAGVPAGLALAVCAAVHAGSVAVPVRSAVVAQDPQTVQEVVDVTLTPEGRRSLADFTRDRVGRRIHLRMDGVLLTSATIRGPIEAGALRLSPGGTGFDGVSAQEIARRLAAGGTMEISDEH